MAKDAEKLTVKEQAFVNEYLKDGNATRSYRAAGYKAVSDVIAASDGFKLLRKPKVRDAVAAGRKAASDRAIVTAEDVYRGLRKEAEFTGDGSSHSARVSAWSHLGKAVGLFVDRLELTGKNGQPVAFIEVPADAPDRGSDAGRQEGPEVQPS